MLNDFVSPANVFPGEGAIHQTPYSYCLEIINPQLFSTLGNYDVKKRKSFAANSFNNVFACHMRWKSDRQYLCTPSVTPD